MANGVCGVDPPQELIMAAKPNTQGCRIAGACWKGNPQEGTQNLQIGEGTFSPGELRMSHSTNDTDSPSVNARLHAAPITPILRPE